MSVPFEISHESIRSYRRLNYTHWHALAEFVDNSTQSYFNNRVALDPIYQREGQGLQVDIVYDKADPGLIRISDTAMGMNLDELNRAFRVGTPPAIATGRSQYGMGLKTAATWLGNRWSVRSKKLGETVEHTLTVDVERVAGGDFNLPHEQKTGVDPDEHYTVVEITQLHQRIHPRQNTKIREFLGSMYRQDFRAKRLRLTWQGQALDWLESDAWFYVHPVTGQRYRKDFAFEIEGKLVRGWVGVLAKGSREKAGFTILHRDRAIKGWPDAWKPPTIFGQFGGSNNLLNQRLVGEVHLDDFWVTHTKDGIVWERDQQDQLEQRLRTEIFDYMGEANRVRKGTAHELGPTEPEVQAAVDQVEAEISSPEFADAVTIEPVPPAAAVEASLTPVRDAVDMARPTFGAKVGQISVKVFLTVDLAPSEPYLVLDTAQPDEVVVIINRAHPHIGQIVGSDGMANYLRHCVYDGVAEWLALHKAGVIHADTVKLLKDRLLRLPIQLQAAEMATPQLPDEPDIEESA